MNSTPWQTVLLGKSKYYLVNPFISFLSYLANEAIIQLQISISLHYEKLTKIEISEGLNQESIIGRIRINRENRVFALCKGAQCESAQHLTQQYSLSRSAVHEDYYSYQMTEITFYCINGKWALFSFIVVHSHEINPHFTFMMPCL